MNASTFFILLLLFANKYLSAQTDLELLKIAYQKKSSYLLGEIFEKWHRNSKRISNEEINNLNDTLKETYQVFKTFYKPKKLNLIVGSEFSDALYQKIKYALIQNNISIDMKDKIYYTATELDSFIINRIMNCNLDSTKKKYFSTKINGKFIPWVMATFQPEDIYEGKDKNVIKVYDYRDFYPIIEDSTIKSINLTKDIHTTLGSFLADTHSHFVYGGGFKSIARAKGESNDRKNFLENYIKIFCGHWGGYWQLETYPEVKNIIFDKNFEYAKVCYRMAYEGYETILKKENNQWKIISSERTWIE